MTAQRKPKAKAEPTRSKAPGVAAKKKPKNPLMLNRHGNSKYTESIALEICERIGNGEPLAKICRDKHMPQLTTVYDWQKAHTEFSERVARAREAGFDQIAQEALTIADTPIAGVVSKLEPGKPNDDGSPGALVVVEQRREDMLGHRKLQVETRLKLLACWDPRRYGQKQEITGPDGGPLVVQVVKFGE